MGYELNIKLKGELDDQFKPYIKGDNVNEIENFRNYIIIFIINCHKTITTLDIMKADKDLRWLYNLFTEAIIQKWKFDMSKEEHEYTFIDRANYDIEPLLKENYRELLLLATTTEHENDNSEIFWDYVQSITNALDSLEENLHDMWNNKFIEFYNTKNDLAEIHESW